MSFAIFFIELFHHKLTLSHHAAVALKEKCKTPPDSYRGKISNDQISFYILHSKLDIGYSTFSLLNHQLPRFFQSFWVRNPVKVCPGRQNRNIKGLAVAGKLGFKNSFSRNIH